MITTKEKASNYRPAPKLTAEAREHDDRVRARASYLRGLVAKLERTEAALRQAEAERDKAAQQWWPDHPKRVEIEARAVELTHEYEICRTAKGELQQLEFNNPRAFGKPWLSVAERNRNDGILRQIEAYRQQIEQLQGQIATPYEPIR
jgi:uncharacterized coiled-coil DUF342 family protein